MITKREARGIIRKAIKRVPEGEEIRHLNIMPMMDMMTILLVVFIFQSATGAAALTVGDVQLPRSRSLDPPPEGAVVVTVAKEAILVEGRPVVAVRGGGIDPSEKKGGALGLEIPKLGNFLGAVRRDNEERARQKGNEVDPLPELMIIADRLTPYRLLVEVIVSARSQESGFRRFRLIVLQQEGGPAPG
jgi:biopolymer transport protein ExbD